MGAPYRPDSIIKAPSKSADPDAMTDPTELPQPPLSSRLVSKVLAIKPLANFAKNKARTMMIERAEGLGVYWLQEAADLRSRGSDTEFSADWEADLAALRDDNLVYPDYYLTSFHAYEAGNLGWEPAMEAEVAAKAVHARIWPEETAEGDAKLRQSYHEIVQAALPEAPKVIADLGCSVGLSTFALQEAFPEAEITGVDLSPYFLAIAQYRARQYRDPQFRNLHPHHHASSPAITWKHAAAESTGLTAGSFDLVSACLMFHELPRSAACKILVEARRLLKPGGHFTLMDMNPAAPNFATMKPYVLTLLKSTEPYLDDYFSFDVEAAIEAAGFERVSSTANTPRHRTIIARAV